MVVYPTNAQLNYHFSGILYLFMPTSTRYYHIKTTIFIFKELENVSTAFLAFNKPSVETCVATICNKFKSTSLYRGFF